MELLGQTGALSHQTSAAFVLQGDNVMQESTLAPVVVNLLLASLLKEELEGIHACGECVAWCIGDILCEPNKPVLPVSFPLTGFVPVSRLREPGTQRWTWASSATGRTGETDHDLPRQ